MIGDLKTAKQETGALHLGLSLAAWRTRLVQSVRDDNGDSARRLLRSIACMVPHDPGLVSDWRTALKTSHPDICASLARMAQCLEPFDRNHFRDRLHYSAKANRPDLMPPHWMRDVLSEAVTLQRLLQDRGLSAAGDFLKCQNLSGKSYYLPRFRALLHFVKFNADPTYKANYLRNCIAVANFHSSGRRSTCVDINQAILDDFIEIARFKEKIDTVISSGELGTYPTNVEKKIRASEIPVDRFTPKLNEWREFLVKSVQLYWKNLIKSDMVSELYGFSTIRSSDCSMSINYHINEILAGPVIGPHYHSGHRFDEVQFPVLSAVYYPKTITKNEVSNAGYLEFGRPEFALPFEASCVRYRPVAGSLIIFPAFAYHGVVPIDQAPRYSINVDVYLKPESSSSWQVSEFFD